MQELRSKKVILSTLVVAGVYIVATVYLMNAGLMWDALIGDHSWEYRWNLMTALLGGMWTAMTPFALALLVVVAVLTGLNMALVVRRLRQLRSSGSLSFAVGGSSFVGIVGSGCASCGLPVLALLGLGGAAAYLPFQGAELSVLAIGLLSFSLYLLLSDTSKGEACVIPTH